jgi:post-segregation antitoxin (ccd killing protein)
MRMARVNISLPDELYRQAKEAGLNISGLARKAIATELDDRAKIAAAYELVDEMEREFGSPTAEELAEAKKRVDRILARHEAQRRETA